MTTISARIHLAQARRIVVKLGTHVVTHDGVELALGRVYALVEDLAGLRDQGKDLIVVSSGAVGMGMRTLGLAERPQSLGLRQACAAVGQGHLIGMYAQAFAELGVTVAQVLLTQEDLADRDRALCLRTTLLRLLELGVVPILNENDSVSVRELIEHRRITDGRAPSEVVGTGFGDNDGLSARVAVALDADLLVLLTDVEGLYTAPPQEDPTATIIGELDAIDDALLARVEGGGGSRGGTGGMASKLEAARLASEAGTAVLIAGGGAPQVLRRALAGELLGTLVAPATRRRERWRHIAFSAPRRGALVVNDGALVALAERKASLLPIGVVAVEGEFARGDVVEIRDGSGRVHGRGLANYDAPACRALAGHH
ncbi:MAG TPA: glutamate 5-kinase, partial [Thermoanaerobaculia bacterium]|nr:glutamate 5-kinase [Thermoanaerobaculia bacterium]